ncbi:MAG TPA: hypothetical protein VKB34_21880 [Povalibacter sp.]|nr:hypothetical protein [Povalibacter sp.]
MTDSSGAFEIAPHKKWSVIILGADYFPMVDRLEISVDGYETTKADVHWSATGRPGGALGTLAMRPATPTAGTPWERYLRAPPSGSAVAVQTATYTAEDDINHRIEVDLPVLENEVAAGDLESIRLAVRLQAQFSAAAAIAEYLDAILGRSIRPNPAAYLQAVAGVKGCPSALPSGDLFVDRDEARIAEARARAKALGSISAAALMQERDECVAMLEGQ